MAAMVIEHFNDAIPQYHFIMVGNNRKFVSVTMVLSAVHFVNTIFLGLCFALTHAAINEVADRKLTLSTFVQDAL